MASSMYIPRPLVFQKVVGNTSSDLVKARGGCVMKRKRLVSTLALLFDLSIYTLHQVQDKHGNVNNLLIVGAERGTGPAEPRTPSPQKKHATPMTAIDKVHEDEFQDDEKYEDSPLMSHEKPSLMTAGGLEVDPGYHGRRTSLGATINRVHTFIPPEPTHEDLKDPELEEFPGNKSGILHRMYTLRQELPIDDSSHLDNNNGTDPMAYHLTRSLEHLSSSIKPPIIAHIERASPKGTSSESSPTGKFSLNSSRTTSPY